MRGLMKNMLTVTGSGCVALGHPARPPKWLPEMPGTRADAAFELLFRTLAAPKSRQRRRNEQATPIPSRKRTAGASRATRVPVANNAAGTVSRRCREQAKEIAAAPGAAARHGLEFMFEAQVFQGKAFPTEAKVRSGWHGDVSSPAVRSTPTAALVVPDPSHSPIIGQAPVSRRRCGAEQAARRPS